MLNSAIDLEHARMRSKDLENKRLIQKLSNDLSRQKNNQLQELVNQASNRRMVRLITNAFILDLRTQRGVEE